MPDLVDQVRALFELDSASVLERIEGGWAPTAVSGVDPPASPEAGFRTVLGERGSSISLTA